MKTSKKNITRISALCVAIIILGVIGYFAYPRESNKPQYIFDKSYHITLADVRAARTPLTIPGYDTNAPKSKKGQKNASADQPKLNLQALFARGLINDRNTLKYFKYLEYLFRKSPDMVDHLAEVKAYLYAHFSPSDAKVLFDAYKKYLRCEMAILTQFPDLSTAKTPQDAIALLERIQAFRRAQLGTYLANTLFGADVKAKEYALRRAEIVMNNNLDGDEKERMIKQLDQNMWGSEAKEVEDQQPAYNRYQEKLQIYQKDLSQMGTADRQAKIEQFRKEYFPPKIVKKLNAIDKEMAAEKAKETEYSEEAKTINDNSNLTVKEKKQQITDLQNQMFGKKVNAFKRQQAISQGLQKFIQEHKNKQNPDATDNSGE